MSIVMIGKFGKSSEGVYTYSINTTTKEDIYTILETVREQGARYWETPNIVKKFKTYHCLLKFYVPNEMGYPDESQ